MSNSPTVFHVLSTLQTAGAETTSVALVARLRSAGLNARLATMRDDRDGLPAVAAEALGLPRHGLGAHRIASIRGLVRLVRLVRSHRPCVLHAQDRDAALLCGAGAWLTRVPFVITRHVLDETHDGRGGPTKRKLLGRALRQADCVVAVSHAVGHRLSVDDRVHDDRLRVIFNSLEPAEVEALSRPDARKALGWLERPTITLVGALRPGKGHEVAIESARLLTDRFPEARVVFVGDGELRQDLERLASGSVDFVGARPDVPMILAASDVVILPSDAEALPTVLIEAALAARPVVATNVGGIPEVVIDGHTGLLVAPQDPSALTAAICQLLETPTLAESIGRAAKVRAIELFAPARQVAALSDLYASILR